MQKNETQRFGKIFQDAKYLFTSFHSQFQHAKYYMFTLLSSSHIVTMATSAYIINSPARGQHCVVRPDCRELCTCFWRSATQLGIRWLLGYAGSLLRLLVCIQYAGSAMQYILHSLSDSHGLHISAVFFHLTWKYQIVYKNTDKIKFYHNAAFPAAKIA